MCRRRAQSAAMLMARETRRESPRRDGLVPSQPVPDEPVPERAESNFEGITRDPSRFVLKPFCCDRRDTRGTRASPTPTPTFCSIRLNACSIETTMPSAGGGNRSATSAAALERACVRLVCTCVSACVLSARVRAWLSPHLVSAKIAAFACAGGRGRTAEHARALHGHTRSRAWRTQRSIAPK